MRRKKSPKQVSPTPPPSLESTAPSTLIRDLCWLVLAGALAFAGGVTGEFLWLDHAEIEEANYRVVDAVDWTRVWTETIEEYQGRRSGVPIEQGGYWRPIYALGISLDWALWNDCAWCDHVENILWHLAVVVGLYLLGNQVFGATPEGRQAVFWATILFAVHPLGVHSVTWISGRKDTMCAAFGVAALVALGHVAGDRAKSGTSWRQTAGWLALAAVCLLLAIGSKELGFIVPVVATVLFMPSLLPVSDPGEKRRQATRLAGLATLWGCALVMVAYRVHVVQAKGLDAPYPTDSLVHNVAMSANLFWHYVLRILVPYQVRLSDAWPRVLAMGAVDTLAILGLGAVIVGMLYGTWRRWPWALALMWFGIWMLPTSGIMPLRHFRAERYLYPASWGVLLAALLLLLPVLSKLFASHGRQAVAVVMTVVVLLFGLKTARENEHWQNDLTLFQHSVAQDPRHVEGQIELSRLALEQGRYDEAIERTQLAIGGLRNPGYVAYGIPFYAYSWQGTALLRAGRPAEAVAAFQQASQYMPNSPKSYYNLATAEVVLGRLTQAATHLERSLELDPGNSEVREKLGLLYLKLGSAADCVGLLESHVSSHPGDVQNKANYATALMLLHRYDEAERIFSELVRSFSDNPIYRARLAWCQWNLGKVDAATRNLDIALTQAPNSADAREVERLIRQHRQARGDRGGT